MHHRQRARVGIVVRASGWFAARRRHEITEGKSGVQNTGRYYHHPTKGFPGSHLLYSLLLVGDLGAPELVLQLRFHLELAQFVARHELRTFRHTVSAQ